MNTLLKNPIPNSPLPTKIMKIFGKMWQDDDDDNEEPVQQPQLP